LGWRQTLRGVVAPWECDDNNHLTARFYVPKFDDSAYILFFDAGVRLPELRGRGFALVTASHHISYIAELRNEDVFAIEAAVVRVGRSSMRSVQKMLNRETGALVATCVGVDTLFDLGSRRSAPWPEDLRAALEAAQVTLSEADRALFER
jgi:acyl-CoA thioester hydrolase